MLALAGPFSTFPSGHNETVLFQRSEGANIIPQIPAATEKFCPLDVTEWVGGWGLRLGRHGKARDVVSSGNER